MQYVTVGATGVRVLPLCFGTMSFGAEADEQTSAEMFHRVREVGVNFFDTADVYAGGASEEILGRLIADCRDEVVLTSKVFWPTSSDVNARGLSRRHIVRGVEASLRRLDTDWIDFYFVHDVDPATPVEETLRVLDDLQRQGKILYPAVSNWAAWQIATALGVSAREGLAKFSLVEPMYNLLRRQAEVEILPLAQAENLGVITYSPLAAGMLTGKYGVKPATLALAWVAAHPGVTAPIVGARNLAQLEDSLAALDVEVPAELRTQVSQLSPTPAPATDRTETLHLAWS